MPTRGTQHTAGQRLLPVAVAATADHCPAPQDCSPARSSAFAHTDCIHIEHESEALALLVDHGSGLVHTCGMSVLYGMVNIAMTHISSQAQRHTAGFPDREEAAYEAAPFCLLDARLLC
ncbi:hypothetical protein CVIRNUC_007129 [Coccomyxa viridis]|uniref:Uncharacterized protein n=1 Tax=Coccomyxa viridis TaxID=1274662 RepID=A0AAV1IDF8_9CHLO|nr:hypothetical protein CVIRNUC_007129 [Coccomyxa viridis]